MVGRVEVEGTVLRNYREFDTAARVAGARERKAVEEDDARQVLVAAADVRPGILASHASRFNCGIFRNT